MLDLTDDANRAAFHDLFLTYCIRVGDHQARVSQLRLYDFTTLMDKAGALSDRLMADALVMHYDYDLSGTDVGAGGQQRQDGVDFVVAGATWQSSSLSRDLTSATAYDMSQGGLEFQIVDCGS